MLSFYQFSCFPACTVFISVDYRCGFCIRTSRMKPDTGVRLQIWSTLRHNSLLNSVTSLKLQLAARLYFEESQESTHAAVALCFVLFFILTDSKSSSSLHRYCVHCFGDLYSHVCPGLHRILLLRPAEVVCYCDLDLLPCYGICVDFQQGTNSSSCCVGAGIYNMFFQ